jgi:hypothetical protein
MPFRDRQGGDLSDRIERELRERLEEALDAACLDTLVRMRRARGLSPPVADSERDRAEYRAEVRMLLDRLEAHFAPHLQGDLRRSAAQGPGDRIARLTATQVSLARALPDYWQRFDAVRLEYAEERATSGSESRGLLRRLFGGG